MILFLNILTLTLTFIIGMCAFSFANVVVSRVPYEKPLFKEHLHCDKCDERLKVYEIIPVFSFIALKGRCRYCGQKIRRRELINELFGGAMAVFTFLRFGSNTSITDSFSMNYVLDITLIFDITKLLGLITIFMFFVMLDIVALSDADTMEIPFAYNIVIFVISIISLITVPGMSILEHVIGLVVASVPLYIIVMIIPGAFGGGDIKLLFAAGLFMGWKLTLLGLFIGIILGGFYGMYLLITKKEDKKGHFAFGPFLCVGFFIAVVCGMDMINGYLGYLASMRQY